MSEQENAALSALVERLQKIQREADGAQADQAMQNLMSGFKAPEAGPEEGDELNEVGREMKRGDREEPNIPQPVGSKIDRSIPRRPSVTTRERPVRP